MTLTSWDAEQNGNARIICDTCRAERVGIDAQIIALMTAMQEASLRNLDYGDRPASLHGAMSSSRGIYQQLDAWGPYADRMDVATATRMFLHGGAAGQRGLLSVPNWYNLPPGVACQTVQESDFPDAYQAHYDDAAALVNSYGTTTTGGSMALTDLADVLRNAGLTVIELPGWQGRGEGGSFNPIGILLHHDAMGLGFNSNPGDDMNVPDYMSQNGNDGSQLWVRRDGAWVAMAAGRKWHAGAGQGYGDVPAGGGNTGFLGVETDHTVGDPWPAEQLDAINRGCRALAQHYGWKASNCAGHKEYAPDRKIDPESFDLDAWRQFIARADTPSKPAPGGNTPTAPPTPPKADTGVLNMDEQTLRKIIREEVHAEVQTQLNNTEIVGTKGGGWTLPVTVREIAAKVGVRLK